MGYNNSTLNNSKFVNPYDLCFDSSTRELYVVVGSESSVIRKISIEVNKVTGICGSNISGYQDGLHNRARFCQITGIALDAKNKYLYVADGGNQVIRKVDMSGKEVIVSTLCGLKSDRRTEDGDQNQARFM